MDQSVFITERLTSLRSFFNSQLDTVQKELLENYNSNLNDLQSTILEKTEEISGLTNQLSDLSKKNNRLNEENANYQKVSLVKILFHLLYHVIGYLNFLPMILSDN